MRVECMVSQEETVKIKIIEIVEIILKAVEVNNLWEK